jgi:hypothetical protein
VVVENYLNSGYRAFANHNQTLGEGEPIWINEMGFALMPGRSEAEQANWWARARSARFAPILTSTTCCRLTGHGLE